MHRAVRWFMIWHVSSLILMPFSHADLNHTVRSNTCHVLQFMQREMLVFLIHFFMSFHVQMTIYCVI